MWAVILCFVVPLQDVSIEKQQIFEDLESLEERVESINKLSDEYNKMFKDYEKKCLSIIDTHQTECEELIQSQKQYADASFRRGVLCGIGFGVCLMGLIHLLGCRLRSRIGR